MFFNRHRWSGAIESILGCSTIFWGLPSSWKRTRCIVTHFWEKEAPRASFMDLQYSKILACEPGYVGGGWNWSDLGYTSTVYYRQPIQAFTRHGCHMSKHVGTDVAQAGVQPLGLHGSVQHISLYHPLIQQWAAGGGGGLQAWQIQQKEITNGRLVYQIPMIRSDRQKVESLLLAVLSGLKPYSCTVFGQATCCSDHQNNWQ